MASYDASAETSDTSSGASPFSPASFFFFSESESEMEMEDGVLRGATKGDGGPPGVVDVQMGGVGAARGAGEGHGVVKARDGTSYDGDL